ncbi:MAG TPA: DNA polymerase III subunit delta [Acidimicrobiales bacterium]|nr:DNA polymerase III subunit delta [Acidimicrobiales bacterium]
MSTATATTPVTLVKGDDEVLLRDAAHELIRKLSAGLDPSFAVEEIGRAQFQPPESSEASIRPLVDAAQTPPFLTDRRVVVGRDVEMFTRAEQVAPLVAYLDDPLPTTSLVLVWTGGRIPKSLADAITRSGGEQLDTSPGRKVAPWVDDQVAAVGLKLDKGASQRLVEWLGDDPQRLVGVLSTLKGTYGAGAKLSASDIEPFLGEPGGVPPWELTDAIDKGDIPVALDRLHRMMAGGSRHPLQIMATLHGHYARMLQLDGARVSGEKGAAALLGMRGSTFPARKALTQVRRLGHDRIVRAIDLLATADLDLRGGKAWPEALVMEVLVARLARLGR